VKQVIYDERLSVDCFSQTEPILTVPSSFCELPQPRHWKLVFI